MDNLSSRRGRDAAPPHCLFPGFKQCGVCSLLYKMRYERTARIKCAINSMPEHNTIKLSWPILEPCLH